jgi:hypothetical protein
MKPKSKMIFQILTVFGIMLSGLVAALDQTETYGAYPGGPIPSVPSEQIAYAYPGGLGGSTATAIYSTNSPPAGQQNILLSYNVETAPPEAVYYGGTYVPWTTFYQTFPASSPVLWVPTSGGWSWYATCPLGCWIQNLMYIPATGPIKFYELYPDGSTRLEWSGLTESGYHYIWFYADTPGRHIAIFTIYDDPSNYITIDVV